MKKLLSRTETPKVSEERARAYGRMRRLSTVDTMNWMDAAGSGVARALDDYRRYGEPDSLNEIRAGLEALLGCVDSLQERDILAPRA
jgi:hypothetical protein